MERETVKDKENDGNEVIAACQCSRVRFTLFRFQKERFYVFLNWHAKKSLAAVQSSILQNKFTILLGDENTKCRVQCRQLSFHFPSSPSMTRVTAERERRAYSCLLAICRHIGTVVVLWRPALTLNFELGLDFLTMHLSTKFHHSMFNLSEVILLTNKHTIKLEAIQRWSAICRV